MSKIYIEVEVTYRDDKKEIFICSDTPSLGTDYLTIFPYNDPLSRKYISQLKISDVSYTYKSK